jgi:hypothetical protein
MPCSAAIVTVRAASSQTRAGLPRRFEVSSQLAEIALA